MIDPVRVFFMIRDTITQVPGRDQSRGSTDQSSGRRSAAAHAWHTALDHAPYGARNTDGRTPTAASASLAREISERIAENDSFDWSAWSHVWFTTTCPAETTSATSERFAATCRPIMQNVALILYC